MDRVVSRKRYVEPPTALPCVEELMQEFVAYRALATVGIASACKFSNCASGVPGRGEAFQKFDEDGSNSIDMDELQKVIKTQRGLIPAPNIP